MKTQHTPGPWRIGENTLPDKLGMQRATVESIVNENPHTICICSGVEGQKPGREAKANARLIAAAPEMLEALELLHKQLAPHFHKLGVKKAFSELAVLAQAQAVIHSAKGS